MLHCTGPSEARCRYASSETSRSSQGQLLQLSADLKSAVCFQTTRAPRVSPTAFASAKTITSRILFMAPTGHRTASRQRVFVYRTTCCDRWTLVGTLHLFYLTSALRSTRLITASFLRNYTESACEVTHFTGCRPTSPTNTVCQC